MSSVSNCSRKRLNLSKCDRKIGRKTKLANRHSDKRFTGKSTTTKVKSRLTLKIDSEKFSLTLKWCSRTWKKKCVKELNSNISNDSINSPKAATKKYGTCKPSKLKSARFKSTKNWVNRRQLLKLKFKLSVKNFSGNKICHLFPWQPWKRSLKRSSHSTRKALLRNENGLIWKMTSTRLNFKERNLSRKWKQWSKSRSLTRYSWSRISNLSWRAKRCSSSNFKIRLYLWNVWSHKTRQGKSTWSRIEKLIRS